MPEPRRTRERTAGTSRGFAVAVVLFAAGCAREGCQPSSANRQANILPPTPFPDCFGAADAEAPAVRFAVIGDFGHAGPDEARVAGLVSGWRPDFVITLGDNNYPNGGADTIDENVGQYFHAFIAPYRGRFGAGAPDNRFFPSLGNHDWLAPGAEPYRAYFTLPGNEARFVDGSGNEGPCGPGMTSTGRGESGPAGTSRATGRGGGWVGRRLSGIG